MPTFNATYTFNGNVQPAALSLLKDKAAIEITTPQGNRTFYWFYYNIRVSEANRSLFTYTEYPPQTLEVLDGALAETLAAGLHKSKQGVAKSRNRTALSLFAGLLLMLALIYFFVLPWSAAALAARVPVTYEKELGQKMYSAMKSDFKIDEARSAYTTAFFEALTIPSKYGITITVVKGDVANAFALPGGHIVIYDKLLNSLTSYPQLAALLTHEFIHIENRHSLKSLFRQASTTLLFAALIGDAGALGGAVLQGADNLKSLSYSRSLESEADAAGITLLAARNIDGKGFIELFQVLQKEPEVAQPEWISSHPQLAKRIRNIEQNPLYKQQRPVTDSTLKYLFLKIKTAD